MILLSLDLEMAQPCGTIIQVGYAIGDTATGEILLSATYNIKSDVVVSEFITKLTGITQDVVDAGTSLYEAYEQMAKYHAKYKCLMNPLTWGGGDSETLRNQLGADGQWVFGRRWIDAKTVYISRRMAQGLPFVGGLKKSMGRMGMAFEGEAHRAEVDAINTFRIYHKLLGEFK